MSPQPSLPPVLHELECRCGTTYGPEELAALRRVLARGAPTSSEECEAFAREFAERVCVRHATPVVNGTAALVLALKAVGVGPGDEVVTTPVTWVATASAAVVLGATVSFADVDPETLNVDPDSVAQLVTEKTKAVVPVHLYGRPVDAAPLLELAEERGVAVVEDAAHAPGAEYRGKAAGSLGHVACFSFHEQKNMSTLGEGGMLVTDDEELFERALLYRSHCARVVGGSSKYLPLPPERLPDDPDVQFWWQDFDDAGFNFRMNDAQAAVGRVQLGKLDANNAKRREIASQLTRRLAEDPVASRAVSTPPPDRPGVKSVHHLFPLLLNEGGGGTSTNVSWRDRLVYGMRLRGVRLGVHYRPVNLSSAFLRRGHGPGECLVAEEAWTRLVTVPVHPRWTPEALEYFVEALSAELARLGPWAGGGGAT
ncbi:MAG: DegT/DnrJ/EryC1/StrS family aminotransferase [Promethearchaeota archaeon]